MKNRLTTSKICAQIVLAAVALSAASGAQACKKYDYYCKGKHEAENAAKKAADEAQQAADQAAAAAKAEADRAAAEAKAAADSFARQGATIGSGEMKNMLNGARNAYADSNEAVQSGYNSSVGKLQSFMNSLLDGIWRTAGKKFVKKSGTFILDMKHRAMNLNADGQAALNRVRRAITAKNIDAQAQADMQLLTKLIVYGGNNIPESVKKSSFGIQVCESAGGGNGGIEACYMMIMQTYLENGKYRVGLARGLGVAASPVPSVIGADVTYGLFWGPGGISDNSGPSIGVALGVVLEEGLEVGVSWGVPTGMPDPETAIPGFAISIGAGAKGEAALTAGYTQVLVKF